MRKKYDKKMQRLSTIVPPMWDNPQPDKAYYDHDAGPWWCSLEELYDCGEFSNVRVRR